MNEILEKVTRYHCKYCKKDFKTPDRHYCKMDPKLKNCWTCKYLKGWDEGYENEIYTEYGSYISKTSNIPNCKARDPNVGEWDIDYIKEQDYDMQCKEWEEGEYDWTKLEVDSLPFD